MEELTALISTKSWDEALQLSTNLSISTSYVRQRQFLATSIHSLDTTLLKAILEEIEDDEFVARASIQITRESTSAEILRVAVTAGLRATDGLVQGLEELRIAVETGKVENLVTLLEQNESAKAIISMRKVLLIASDKLETWQKIWAEDEIIRIKAEAAGDEEDEMEGWDDLESSPKLSIPASHCTLRQFLDQPLLDIALSLAAADQIPSLLILTSLYADSLWPHRLLIIETIPEWEEPQKYLELLPGIDSRGHEKQWSSRRRWRSEKDWVESIPDSDATVESIYLTAEEITSYYIERISLLSSFGLISNALSLVQHGAALGVAGLEGLGEELSLLSKLVYDRPSPLSLPSTSRPLVSSGSEEEEDFTLDRWRKMSNSEVVQAYLAHSTPTSICVDIRRLVLPYIYVIESHLERSGNPDPNLATRLLYEYVLYLAATTLRNGTNTKPNLGLLVSIFEGSKPTLPKSARIIRSDEDLARLALACLYGCKDTTSEGFERMGAIFECLPAFEGVDDGPTTAAQRTLFQLFPSGSMVSSTSFFDALANFTASSLSNALDALDLHLATADTFSRYSNPVQLSWFITSHEDAGTQRAWLTRMARTSWQGEGANEDDEEWISLLEDLAALLFEDEDEIMKKAFWKVEREEFYRIFFAGLLASGKFTLAKKLFHPSSGAAPVSAEVEEELFISASHEFYDNADSGNLNKGEMKLAYDCILSAPQTILVKKEKDFIEATSRLYTFKISTASVPLSPISIRLSDDRLSFVSRLLASNEDSYRHPDVILDLVRKLGYQNDKLAEMKALAMIADLGFQSEDFERSAETCEKLYLQVENWKKLDSSDSERLQQAAEVAWRSCYQIGKHQDYRNLERRKTLLGQALLLCPADRISSLLPAWNSLEDQLSITDLPAPSITIPLQNHLTNAINSSVSPIISDVAGRTYNRAAAFFPFRSSTPHGPNQKPAITNASGGGFSLTKGVGWLIGADENF